MGDQGDSSLEQRRLRVALIDTDTMVQNLVENPEYNGLGGRIVRYVADKDRFVVRMHYTARTLLLRLECLGDSFDQYGCAQINYNGLKEKHGFMVREEEMIHAACGMIRRDHALRKELSERAYQGIEEKGP
jgi:hypothetical protein